MKLWTERPVEIANLFNPAFCAILVKEGVTGFAEFDQTGMPFALTFLLLPIVLHKVTREALPPSIATKMHPWIQERQEARVGFRQRCASLSGHCREAVLYALSADLVALAEGAKIQPTNRKVSTSSWPRDSEFVNCARKSRFVGRWFANAGEVATVYAMWGIRP